jgi:hypothetical protein
MEKRASGKGPIDFAQPRARKKASGWGLVSQRDGRAGDRVRQYARAYVESSASELVIYTHVLVLVQWE